MDSTTLATSGILDLVTPFSSGSLPNMVFFAEINDFLDDEIREFGGNLLRRVAKFVGGVALTVVTWWIVLQGYRIVSGQSREPMMALVANSLRAVLIVGVAVGAAAGASSTYGSLTKGLNEVVREAVTGDSGAGSYADIDRTLAIMQVAVAVIDELDTGDDVMVAERKDRAMLFAGVGLGGPAIMAAIALLLNKIAFALIVGLGPIFILCLLFEPTKPLFSKWLHYALGTMFSMAFLTVMVTLALDMAIAVGVGFWVGGGASSGEEGLTNMALQQGGLGLVLSMLILVAPPMAAMFFQGVMGSFSGYNALQGQASPPGSNIPPTHQAVPPVGSSPMETSPGRGSVPAHDAFRGQADNSHGDSIRVGPR